MKRGRLVLLVLFLGCEPHFQSGKTQCSDKGECPSGFVCRNDGTRNVCFDVKTTGGSGGSGGRGGSIGSGGSSGQAGAGGSSACSPTPVTPACQSQINSSTDPCQICLGGHCCSQVTACSSDTYCRTNYAGPIWDAYSACFDSCCSAACNGAGGQGGSSGGAGTAGRDAGAGSGGQGGSRDGAADGPSDGKADAGGPGVCVATPVTPTCQSLISATTGACTNCVGSNCCSQFTACALDTNCSTNGTGPLADALVACSASCCSVACSGGGPDAGVPDARIPDTGVPDTRLPDAAVPDSRVPDTAPPDTRLPDSAAPDSRLPDSAAPDSRLPDSAVQTCPPPAAGGTCNVFPSCGCPTGQVCYPDTPLTGLTCTSTGGLGDGADCSSGVGCASGLGCFGEICTRYCQSDSDCAAIDTARACLPTYWDTGDTILGVSVCARVCDPVSPRYPHSPLLSCPVGFGCRADTAFPGASDCVQQPGIGLTDSLCSVRSDCAPGYFCSSDGTCVKYCYLDSDCPAYTACTSFLTLHYAGTTEVGYCY